MTELSNDYLHWGFFYILSKWLNQWENFILQACKTGSRLATRNYSTLGVKNSFYLHDLSYRFRSK